MNAATASGVERKGHGKALQTFTIESGKNQRQQQQQQQKDDFLRMERAHPPGPGCLFQARKEDRPHRERTW